MGYPSYSYTNVYYQPQQEEVANEGNAKKTKE